uniref:Uncharacterized protein n=1 Tax=Amazona collaria TaxID=241587 RepID=A0A8B9F0Y9_9PSIT
MKSERAAVASAASALSPPIPQGENEPLELPAIAATNPFGNPLEHRLAAPRPRKLVKTKKSAFHNPPQDKRKDEKRNKDVIGAISSNAEREQASQQGVDCCQSREPVYSSLSSFESCLETSVATTPGGETPREPGWVRVGAATGLWNPGVVTEAAGGSCTMGEPIFGSEPAGLAFCADRKSCFVGILTFVYCVLSIGSRVEHGVFDFGHGLNWVGCTDDLSILQRLQKLSDFGSVCLGIFFGQCKGCITKVALKDCNLVEEFKAVTYENCRKNSESMKQKGNEEFSQGNFFCPANHLLYGNRALCLILTQQLVPGEGGKTKEYKQVLVFEYAVRNH